MLVGWISNNWYISTSLCSRKYLPTFAFGHQHGWILKQPSAIRKHLPLVMLLLFRFQRSWQILRRSPHRMFQQHCTSFRVLGHTFPRLSCSLREQGMSYILTMTWCQQSWHFFQREPKQQLFRNLLLILSMTLSWRQWYQLEYLPWLISCLPRCPFQFTQLSPLGSWRSIPSR